MAAKAKGTSPISSSSPNGSEKVMKHGFGSKLADMEPNDVKNAITGYDLRTRIEALVAAVTGKEIKTIYIGSGACTGKDSKTGKDFMVLPSIPQTLLFTRSEAMTLLGYAAHEISHQLETDFESIKDIFQDLEKPTKEEKQLKEWWNAIEDYRIEKLTRKEFPGFPIYIGVTRSYTAQRFIDYVAKGFYNEKELSNPYRIGAVGLTWVGAILNGFQMRVHEEALNLLGEDLQQWLRSTKTRLSNVETKEDSFVLARELLEELRSNAEKESESKDSDESENQNNQDENQNNQDEDRDDEASKDQDNQEHSEGGKIPEKQKGNSGDGGQSDEEDAESGNDSGKTDDDSSGQEENPKEEDGSNGNNSEQKEASDDKNSPESNDSESDDEGDREKSAGDSESETNDEQSDESASDGENSEEEAADSEGKSDSDNEIGEGESSDENESDQIDSEESSGKEDSDSEEDGAPSNSSRNNEDNQSQEKDGDTQANPEKGESAQSGNETEQEESDESESETSNEDSSEGSEKSQQKSSGAGNAKPQKQNGQETSENDESAPAPKTSKEDEEAEPEESDLSIQEVLEQLLEMCSRHDQTNVTIEEDLIDHTLEGNPEGREEEVRRNQKKYSQIRQNVGSSAARSAGIMRRLLLSQNKTNTRRNLEQGRLDLKRLVPIVNGSKNVYYEKNNRKDVNSAVSILVDNSGSMSGLPLAICQQAAVVLDMAISGTDTDLEINGFTGSASEPVIYRYRKFGQKGQASAATLGTMDEVELGGTPIGVPILEAHRRLMGNKAPRKIMIVITDGGAEDPEVAREAHDIAIASGCLVFAIGIGNVERYLGQWCDNFHVITDINELPIALTSIVQTCIQNRTRKAA